MGLPYSWLKELVDCPWSPTEMAHRLTLCGTAAVAAPFMKASYEHITIGHITALEPIKGTDHLTKAIVSNGTSSVQVVCGAPNAAAGQKIVLAQEGATLAGGMAIKKVKLRGVESQGMICSERELGLSDDHSGILVLDDDAPLGAAAASYLGIDDYILEFDLTPNRGDALSVIGVARDLAALLKTNINRPQYALSEVSESASNRVKVGIEDPEACPRYAARIISGVKIGPSPWWIKRKLILSGIRPISNVVDITNLVMLELGHPLHAFDFRLFARREVLVRRARPGESFTTLDGRKHELTSDVLLITDGEKGVAAAGVMGGMNSEVSSETTDILLESAYFNPVTVRRSRRKLEIVSESSTRFERGADPNIVPEAINRAAHLIQKYAGGEVLSGIVDCHPRPLKPIVVELRPARANMILGTNTGFGRMAEILTHLEFGVEAGDPLKVTVPTFRSDISREIDLIEEIARIEGYDAIPDVNRNIGPLFTERRQDDLFRRSLREIMTAQGFDEIYGTSMADPARLDKLTAGARAVRILNPIAEDLSCLQTTAGYSLLKAAAHNIAYRNLDLRLFTLGQSFLPTADMAAPKEIEELGLILAGRSADNWYGKGREHDFYEIKGVMEAFCEAARLPGAEFVPFEAMPFDRTCSFRVEVGGQVIGHAGQVREDIQRAFDIKQTVFMAVLDFEKLMQLRGPEPIFRPLPRFPSAPRDLAVVVDEAVRVGEIVAAIREMGGGFLETVELFDLYRGKQVGEGKKSLAFALSYRSNERSLEGTEVLDIHGKIVDYIKHKFNAEVREG